MGPSSEYTTIAVRDLPYPDGLGKGDYEDLEREMRRLLGKRHSDSAVHQRSFWAPQYQRLIATYLEPMFARSGQIADVAAAAAQIARGSDVFGQEIPRGVDAYGLYAAKLPAWDSPAPTLFEREVRWWVRDPPRLVDNRTELLIDDGRHRLSLLRSKIEPLNPDFEVLVLIVRT